MTEPPGPELSPRRREILDAAVAVLSRHGWRGLTHRAIDREAGLPEGSSSAYYRSRSALQGALGEHVVRHVALDLEDLAAQLDRRPGDVPHAVAATTATILGWLEDPDLLKAKLELTMAATRDPELAIQLIESRRKLTELVDGVLERGGHDHAGGVATTIVAAVDGVLVAALLQPSDERPALVSRSLDLLLGALVEGRPIA